jgi:hypothetical protein
MDSPTYVLGITPSQPNQVKHLFELGVGMPNELLEHPPTFRYAGWSLETLDRAKIVGGECLELRNGDRKVLRLHEDGTLAINGAIDDNFLAWGDRRPDQAVHIHALAIIEFTTGFVYLYNSLIPTLASKPDHLRFHIEIVNGKIDGKLLRIVPFEINTVGFLFKDGKRELSSENPTYSGTVSLDEFTADLDKIAFEIVSRLFLFFGVPANSIPYTIERDGIRRVDVARISAMK